MIPVLAKLLGRLFGGARGSGGAPDDRSGIYLHVRCRACGEIIRVRVNRHNDLSPIEDGDGFHVRKSIIGRHCFRRIDAEFTFAKAYRQVDATIAGGVVATREEWEAWEASHPAPAPAEPS